MTHGFDLDLDHDLESSKMNQHAKYLSEKVFTLK